MNSITSPLQLMLANTTHLLPRSWPRSSALCSTQELRSTESVSLSRLTTSWILSPARTPLISSSLSPSSPRRYSRSFFRLSWMLSPSLLSFRRSSSRSSPKRMELKESLSTRHSTAVLPFSRMGVAEVMVRQRPMLLAVCFSWLFCHWKEPKLGCELSGSKLNLSIAATSSFARLLPPCTYGQYSPQGAPRLPYDFSSYATIQERQIIELSFSYSNTELSFVLLDSKSETLLCREQICSCRVLFSAHLSSQRACSRASSPLRDWLRACSCSVSESVSLRRGMASLMDLLAVGIEQSSLSCENSRLSCATILSSSNSSPTSAKNTLYSSGIQEISYLPMALLGEPCPDSWRTSTALPVFSKLSSQSLRLLRKVLFIVVRGGGSEVYGGGDIETRKGGWVGQQMKQQEKYLLFTYKSQIVKRVESTYYESDSGWGCMLRVGQMAIGNYLLLRRHMPLRTILSLTWDNSDLPFSIQAITHASAQLFPRKQHYEWYNPCEMGFIIKHLLEPNLPDLAVKVFLDNALFLSEIPTHKPHLLLLLMVRIGLDEPEAIHLPVLEKLMRQRHFFCALGGTPKHAHLFLRAEGNKIGYLDPHKTTKAPADEEELLKREGEFVSELSWIKLNKIDSSMALVFSLPSAEVGALWEELEGVRAGSKDFFLYMQRERPEVEEDGLIEIIQF